MRPGVTALTAAAVLFTAWTEARADLGWTEDQYTRAYGPGQRGYARVNERAYRLGDHHLVVEFPPEGSQSIGELWILSLSRETLPPAVVRAAEAAEKGPEVERVTFKAKSSLPAEVREAEVNGVVVRVDVRNGLVQRVAFCGRTPACGLWQRLFGPPCESKVACPVLERALAIDRTMDHFHQRAEQAVQNVGR